MTGMYDWMAEDDGAYIDLDYAGHCAICGVQLVVEEGPPRSRCRRCAGTGLGRPALEVSEHWPTRDGLLGAAALVVVVLALGLLVYAAGGSWGTW